MRKARLLSALLLMYSNTSAFAVSLTINFTNQSGDTINELALTSKQSPNPPAQDTLESPEPPVENNVEPLEPAVQNILAAPIAAGDSGVVTIEAAEGECVFNLTFTFASGKMSERPDTDVCQSDAIVIE